jgi:two-component system, cell cycle response regulator
MANSPRSDVTSGAVLVRAEPGSTIAAGLVLELNERRFAARLATPDEPIPAKIAAVVWVLEQRTMFERLQRAHATSPVPNLVLAATRPLAREALEHLDERDDLTTLSDAAEVIEWRLRRMLQQALRSVADLDALTGLLGRRAYMARIERAVNSPVTEGATGVIYLDLDDFKRLNDTLGHVGGDMAIRAVAASLEHVFEPDDVVARIGGNEFAVLLTRADTESLVRAGTAALRAVAATHVRALGQHPPLLASAGLALMSPGSTETQLLSEADVAMYEAKCAGGNRLVFYRDEDEGGDHFGRDLRLRHFESATRVATERLVEMITLKGRRIIDEAKREANVCALTELYNRRFFMTQLPREIERARAERRPLSIMLLDIDHFRDVNSTHGWPTGDRVLQAFAAVLRSAVRTTDWVARYGGEEFVIVMPNASLEIASQVAERVRHAFAATDVESIAGQRVTTTSSAGVAELTDADDSAIAFLQQASEALRQAKSGGRNQVVTRGLTDTSVRRLHTLESAHTARHEGDETRM